MSVDSPIRMEGLSENTSDILHESSPELLSPSLANPAVFMMFGMTDHDRKELGRSAARLRWEELIFIGWRVAETITYADRMASELHDIILQWSWSGLYHTIRKSFEQ